VKYESSSESIHPAYRFWMTARDLTRLAVLFQQQGQWNGQHDHLRLSRGAVAQP
jgi:hypothetical protein